MPDPLIPPAGERNAGDRLESWKDIAHYLGREVRTVQLWEKNESLPVHRHQHARQGSVYAFRTELDAWRQSRAVPPEAAAAEPPAPPDAAPASQEPGAREAAIGAPAHRRWMPVAIAAAAVLMSLAAAAVWWRSRSAPPAGPTAVVVLPFLDMSPAKDQEYFSDGLTEEIIDALSRVPNLHVVARTSAFAYKGKNTDIRKIAQQLNVDSVLEGSVRKDGGELRITAQLNRAADGFHYWSRTYDRPLKDVFGVQREISQAIANQLRAGQLEQRQPTQDLEAYRLYQEGKYFFNQFEPDSFPKAIERFRQAVDRDPKFALAYAGLADAYSYLAEFTIEPSAKVIPQARDAAEKAVALDPSSGEAHTALGTVKLDFDWDRPAAAREFARASELNPSSSWAHHWRAHLLESQMRLDDAMAEYRAAMDLDPLSEPLHWDLSNDLIGAGRSSEAIADLEKAHELFPGNPIFLELLTVARFRHGDIAGAHATLKQIAGNPQVEEIQAGFIPSWRGILADKQGRSDEAQQAVQELERLRTRRFVDGLSPVELCLEIGDKACALTWIGRMHDEHSPFFVYLPLYFRDKLAQVPEARRYFADIR